MTRLAFSNPISTANDFERWLPAAFAEIGAFTALVVLVDIGETRVTPLRSTYVNVIGDEVGWKTWCGCLQNPEPTGTARRFSPWPRKGAGRSTIHRRG